MKLERVQAKLKAATDERKREAEEAREAKQKRIQAMLDRRRAAIRSGNWRDYIACDDDDSSGSP